MLILQINLDFHFSQQVDELEGWNSYMERYTAVKRKMDWTLYAKMCNYSVSAWNEKDILMDSSLICPIYGEVKFTPYFYRFCYIFVIMVFEKQIHHTRMSSWYLWDKHALGGWKQDGMFNLISNGWFWLLPAQQICFFVGWIILQSLGDFFWFICI